MTKICHETVSQNTMCSPRARKPYMHRAVSGVDRISMSEATQSTCLLCSVENRCSTLKETRTPSGLLTTQGSRTAHRPCLVECVGSQLSCLDGQQEYWLFL